MIPNSKRASLRLIKKQPNSPSLRQIPALVTPLGFGSRNGAARESPRRGAIWDSARSLKSSAEEESQQNICQSIQRVHRF